MENTPTNVLANYGSQFVSASSTANSGNAISRFMPSDEKVGRMMQDERNKEDEQSTLANGKYDGFAYKIHSCIPSDMFKAINMELPLHVSVPNSFSDDVSVLYEDPDWEEENCLPQSTIDVLESVFVDESEEW